MKEPHRMTTTPTQSSPAIGDARDIQVWNEAIEAAATAIDKRREAYEETCATYERGYVPDDDNRVLEYKSIAQLVRSVATHTPSPVSGERDSIDATKLAADIAHKILDYFNSTPANGGDDETDDWCEVRDIVATAILTALSSTTAGGK